ncbi:hypothetical protein TKK_0016380 [Trichogramma kaykai]|uniref:mRNA export factor GLE1 n=1 Tax=Trichogramma kaykai TaxID=54128 RepID=A0ABD2W7B1_9HYME
MSFLRNNSFDSPRRVVLKSNNNSFHSNSSILSNGADITQEFESLKISIFNKAARVSGEINHVTIGPKAVTIINESNVPKSPVIDSESKENKRTVDNTPQKVLNSKLKFSIKKILLENEVQRRDKVKKAIDQKKKEMESFQRNMQDELSVLMEQMVIQKEKELEEKLARLEAEEEEYALQERLEKQKELQKQRLKENEEISKKMIPFRDRFSENCRDIAQLCQTCKDSQSATELFAPYAVQLKELTQEMQNLNEKAKAGDLGVYDLQLADSLYQCSNEIYKTFKASMEKFDELYELEIAKREQEMKQAELNAQAEAEKILQETQAVAASQPQDLTHNNLEQLVAQIHEKTEVDNVVSSQTSFLPPPSAQAAAASITAPLQQIVAEVTTGYPDPESYKLYENSKQHLEKYIASFDDFATSTVMKKFKFECQKLLNITVNSISQGSREQLVEKYDKLKSFLSGRSSPNILTNPQAEAFSKHLLAQKIVDQGDTTVSVKPELAFPFAAIAIALWNDWPDFGELLIARFHVKSPFFVPVFLSQSSDQSETDYYKLLGCKFNDNGTPEKPDQFWKRLGGVMYMYASIIITKQRKGIDKPHPHGVGNAWRWLAATVNIAPRSDNADICATLIFVLLEVTGNELWKTYPKQFPKLLMVLNNDYYAKLKSFDAVTSAPIARLGDFLETAIKSGTIPPPKGQLPVNFW